jgi:hypothetical protein
VACVLYFLCQTMVGEASGPGNLLDVDEWLQGREQRQFKGDSACAARCTRSQDAEDGSLQY